MSALFDAFCDLANARAEAIRATPGPSWREDGPFDPLVDRLQPLLETYQTAPAGPEIRYPSPTSPDGRVDLDWYGIPLTVSYVADEAGYDMAEVHFNGKQLQWARAFDDEAFAIAACAAIEADIARRRNRADEAHAADVYEDQA